MTSSESVRRSFKAFYFRIRHFPDDPMVKKDEEDFTVVEFS